PRHERRTTGGFGRANPDALRAPTQPPEPYRPRSARDGGLCLDAPFDRLGRDLGLDPGPEPGMRVDDEMAAHDLDPIGEVREAHPGLDPGRIEADARVIDGE